jgi:hypothetical protein
MATYGKDCNYKPPEPEIEKEKIVKEPILLIPLPSPRCNEKWNYALHGDDWNCACAEGLSPVEIRNCP